VFIQMSKSNTISQSTGLIVTEKPAEMKKTI
jgi:hypothetical protein